MDKPRILVAIRPALYHDLFTREADARLRRLGQLRWLNWTERPASADLAAWIGGCDAVITGWGTPIFTDEVLAAADRLKLIAHSAGSIKRRLPPAVFARVRVSHAAAVLAPPVAEMTLLFIMLALRQVHRINRAMKDGGWAAGRAFGLGHEVAGQRIGIVGAGHTGRGTIRLLRAMNAELWVYDPYLDEAAAQALQVKKVDLETLLRGCKIVSLHAPVTEETRGMMGAEQFGWLQDGAIFVNTARADLIDEAALLTELRAGRIFAALDVFGEEPLPNENPFRKLDNVMMTPHISAYTQQARHRQGQLVVDEIDAFFHKGSLRYEVTRAMLETMA